MNFGLTLPNRGVLFGVTTPEQMLQMAHLADESDVFQSVWVGDSLLGKPRMESLTLLAGVAARTSRVRLGPACMASFPLRDPVLLAYQWASLDLLAAGRSVLVVCTGIIPQEGGRIEGELYGLQSRDRVQRMLEFIELVKLLWTQDNVTFEGKHYRCEGISIEPKPAARPRPPIWIANNPPPGNQDAIRRTLKRVINHADGWETSLYDPADVGWRMQELKRLAVEAGRDPSTIETHLYHNINVNEDRQAAIEESKRFLDTYYTMNYSPEFVAGWTATGSPDECVEHLRVYKEMGFDEVTLRMTGWDQFGQLERVTREVLPRLMD
ncbi:MAG TPA: LLM class flavin-dependent oxidoreductase [Chloroflexota bacterium]|jgi:alkanesulfonate monooxygenase SsuD/methylene tetrahydromethanopterin reductase-like flavin-dependent oxidoreductase (luciferase family)